ncbi:hypothetical protein ACP4OV_004745 [Aristida adscensionis]
MERQQQQRARRNLPRRGQVKLRIFASLFRCLVPKAAGGGKNKEGGGSGGGSRRRVAPRG